ncbi:ABC transporter permease [Mechercharimyces sp. CAU 1602]|uniref:ABC transporter permease n=1 Tax=Mechercharimyces sp. CAU 1602 TaxID=2973933 RepID=UPI0021633CB7|nr:ABC transporter permease [Mechercharimyces sp. CAU 1602]MCS1351247.1 ABC transporter permease [Mechercharimyces sp. CAU 1602]
MQALLKMNRQSPLLLSLISVVLGLVVGAIFMLIAGYNPITAYGALFASAFLDPFDIGETLRQTAPLLLTGLAVALAFRTGLFNIGVEGQVIVGSLAAVIVGTKMSLPYGLHAFVAVLAGALAGALWAYIPGLLKAKRGVHEVITTIMMNFIALSLANVLIREWLAGGSDKTERISENASIRVDWLSSLFANSRINLSVFIALLIALFMYFLLWRTTYGYEMRSVGLNKYAAQYAGINVNRNIVMSMMISGSFAGIAGASEVLGTFEYLAIQESFTGLGFDGIAVALLGANTVIGTIFSAFLFGALTYGGGAMQFEAGVPFEVVRVVFAAIILFVAANISSIIGKALGLDKRGDKDA